MHKFKHALLALPMLLLASMVQAQTAGTITFTANKTSATGSLVPVLTWSTTPVASSCTASGAWSGTKFASGSQTLASITSSKAYTLTCSWGNGSSTVSWTKPTKNTDNSSLTNLTGYKVMFGNSASALNQSKSISDPNATSTTIAALASGTWYFAVRAVNASNVESDNSAVVSKTIASASAAKTVNITITGGTTTSLKVVNRDVYEVLTSSSGYRSLGRKVGTIAIGKPCQSSYKVYSSHYKVTLSDVAVTVTPRSSSVVARCAIS
ncbi:MAG: hypothetical protein ABI821_17870 [Pseudomonadota bacterium]